MIGFQISGEKYEEAKKWMRERAKYSGAIGGQFSFVFTPTSIGTFCKITDGEEYLDLTDDDF